MLLTCGYVACLSMLPAPAMMLVAMMLVCAVLLSVFLLLICLCSWYDVLLLPMVRPLALAPTDILEVYASPINICDLALNTSTIGSYPTPTLAAQLIKTYKPP